MARSVAVSTLSMLTAIQSRTPDNRSKYAADSLEPLVTIDVVRPHPFALWMRSGSHGQSVGSPPAKLIFSNPNSQSWSTSSAACHLSR